jgi:trehalose 6-phosphate synthase
MPGFFVDTLKNMVEKNCPSLVVLANRLPLCRDRDDDGWRISPGGLVSALGTNALRGKNLTWVGWDGAINGSAVAFEVDGVKMVPVSLDEDETREYYKGFANSCLWPLFHDSIGNPEFRRDWWHTFCRVNLRFAKIAASTAESGATVWIHDYHLQLVPQLLRELRPDLRIGFFLHIPFPAREIMLRLPWRREIIEGLLGADVIGFQTSVTAQNFMNSVERMSDATVQGSAISHEGRSIEVDAFPAGVDIDRCDQVLSDPATKGYVAALRELVGPGRRLLLGVDRLDYTKGIELRLSAIRELLDAGLLDPDSVTVVQIAEPSREDSIGYGEVQAQVERVVGGINGDHGTLERRLVHYVRSSVPFEQLVALYSIADVMLVTPFRDGMNLVSKEFVACSGDSLGVLILSEFAGAALELDEALLVNPYDIENVKRAILQALEMSECEQKYRMKALRGKVREGSASSWVADFLGRLQCL